MAVEAQAKMHSFYKKLSGDAEHDGDDDDFVISDDEEVADHSAQPPFTFNFYHDLESVFWMYYWVLHNRLPAATTAQPHVDLKVLTSLKKQSDGFFQCSLDGNTTRLLYMSNAEANALPKDDPLLSVYTSDFHSFVKGTRIAKYVSNAHSTLQKSEPDRSFSPPRWAEDRFLPRVYAQIMVLLHVNDFKLLNHEPIEIVCLQDLLDNMKASTTSTRVQKEPASVPAASGSKSSKRKSDEDLPAPGSKKLRSASRKEKH